MNRPLAIDLFCGSFGWSAGWLELGGRVVGFDLEHEPYHGPVPLGADLVLQDVRTINGAQFRDASLIVASSPCQEFSYRAMPWKKAKALGPPVLGMELFAQAERIQREAIAAAGRFIPMVQENVRGAQPWVGRARWHYGSYYLWGDVPALMPITLKAVKVGGLDWSKYGQPGYKALGFNTTADQRTRAEVLRVPVVCQGCGVAAMFTDATVEADLEDFQHAHVQCAGSKVIVGQADRATKNSGGSWFNVAHNTTSWANNNPARGDGIDGVKQAGISGERNNGKGNRWFQDGAAAHGSKTSARKAASARIAVIPLPLARHIARCYFPSEEST